MFDYEDLTDEQFRFWMGYEAALEGILPSLDNPEKLWDGWAWGCVEYNRLFFRTRFQCWCINVRKVLTTAWKTTAAIFNTGRLPEPGY